MALAMSLRAEDRLWIGWEENDVASYPNRRWNTKLDHDAKMKGMTKPTAFLSSSVGPGSATIDAIEAREFPAIISLDMCVADSWDLTPPPSATKYSMSICICASAGDVEPTSRPEIAAIHSAGNACPSCPREC